jgi:predicted Fe-Mo cluster-binding NifX family protein
LNKDKEQNMRIAAVTEDGKTICQHFGRAPYYLVLTVEDGKITQRERRDKMGHQNFANQPHAENLGPDGRHGTDPSSQAKHASMAGAITDCQVLLAGGMGYGAYESMKSHNIKPVVTDVEDIEVAAVRYIAGILPNLMDRVH